MKLTRDEWMREAERSAAHKFGADNAGWFTFRRFLAGPLGVLALVGIAGLGAYWLWNRITEVLTGVRVGGHLPTVWWVLVGLLLVVTVVSFTPAAITKGGHLLLRFALFGLAWLAVLAFTVAYVIF